MPINPLTAYRQVERDSLSGRELEANILNRGAAMLVDLKKAWDAPDLEARLEEALRYNQRIWSIFQSEAASAQNPLPDEIKHNILVLSVFIDSQIFKTMAYPSPDKLDAIININHNVAAGLMERPQSAQPAGQRDHRESSPGPAA
jgi:flagellar biosynthesis activator protein FlaF